MSEITKRFSDGAKRVITSALLAAREMGHTYVGSEHLLLGILKEESTPKRLLAERGAEYGEIKQKIIEIVGMGSKCLLSADDMTPICRRIILRASFIASAEDSISVGTEHILMSMLREECVATRLLHEISIDTEELHSVLYELYCDNEYIYESDEEEEMPQIKEKRIRSTPLLDANALDLTEKAREKRIDPVIGRENELGRMISILLRRTKNNPCLVGEAGVGKTAIVEALAQKIADSDVPDELLNKRIMSLELSMVVAGTKYRGEFEEKIKKILDEVRDDGEVILFIDEMHTIVGAGGAEGAIDASNILKPALARGEIRLIGATTHDEYRESIEKDKALARRFQPVTVDEPSEEECLEMLRGIRKKYESYHGVTISDEAINAAVSLSVRYIADRSLPDKAIDLIDEAAARLKLTARGRKKPCLKVSDIASAAEQRTGIPLTDIDINGREQLDMLEETLKKRIIGQDGAISSLCKAVRLSRSGIRHGGRPNASFLFIGKNGVGKTECAKVLASAVFKSEKSFIRLDMSEFSEPHSVSKLIGSPPGYVGFGEKNSLTERVKRSPYSLVLFDEIEKAHRDVHSLLLQILDEGRLTDSAGQTVRFDNTIIIMTANGGKGSGGIGFGAEASQSAATEAAKLLAPEIVDRVDETVWFKPLTREELCEVASRSLSGFAEQMNKAGYTLALGDGLAEQIVEMSASASARAVSRCALRIAEEAISPLILGETLAEGEKLTIFIENGAPIAKINQNSY